jgi:hypothetical protein
VQVLVRILTGAKVSLIIVVIMKSAWTLVRLQPAGTIPLVVVYMLSSVALFLFARENRLFQIQIRPQSEYLREKRRQLLSATQLLSTRTTPVHLLVLSATRVIVAAQVETQRQSVSTIRPQR